MHTCHGAGKSQELSHVCSYIYTYLRCLHRAYDMPINDKPCVLRLERYSSVKKKHRRILRQIFCRINSHHLCIHMMKSTLSEVELRAD